MNDRPTPPSPQSPSSPSVYFNVDSPAAGEPEPVDPTAADASGVVSVNKSVDDDIVDVRAEQPLASQPRWSNSPDDQRVATPTRGAATTDVGTDAGTGTSPVVASPALVQQDAPEVADSVANPVVAEPAKTSSETPVATTPVAQTSVAATPVAATPVAEAPVAAAPVAAAPVAESPVAADEVESTTPAPLEGMGAIVSPDGIGFRVWAPNAHGVNVMGSFNDWDRKTVPLESENNGYWYGFSADASAGDEYKFIIHTESEELDRIDPYARQVTNSVGNGVIYDHDSFDWEGDAFDVANHNELVIYEMHIGSFYDTSDEDPGTFTLATQKLDHLVDLGVNAIQIMPISEFAGDVSWGYNPAHIFAVESAYGGPDAFKQFVKEAHARGLAVILDVVYNHFGPSDLDLWRFDGWSENDKGGIYFYNDYRSHTPWGDTRPDYGRIEVRRFIHDNALEWMREYHLDGLRYDMTPYVRTVNGMGDEIPDGWFLMRWLNTSIRAEFPRAITIAEDMQGNPHVTKTHDDGAAFHTQWDGAFVHPVREAITVARDEHRDIAGVRDALITKYNNDAFQRVVYTESHDEVANGKARVPAEVNVANQEGYFARKRSTLGAALVFTAPGIPMLFQGQEFLEGDWFRDDVPLDWSRTREFRGVVNCYRDLAYLRRNIGEDSKGLTGQGMHLFHMNDANNMIAFQRWFDHGPGDDVVVVVNLSASTYEGYRIGFPTGGHWKLLFNSDADAYSPDFGALHAHDVAAVDQPYDGFGASGELSIAPYTALVYSLAE